MRAQLQISAMTQDKWTVGELFQILANNLVPGGDGGHLRTFTTRRGASENVLYNPAPAESFDFSMDLSCNDLLWYARPQLFFLSTVCPTEIGRAHV